MRLKILKMETPDGHIRKIYFPNTFMQDLNNLPNLSTYLEDNNPQRNGSLISRQQLISTIELKNMLNIFFSDYKNLLNHFSKNETRDELAHKKRHSKSDFNDLEFKKLYRKSRSLEGYKSYRGENIHSTSNEAENKIYAQLETNSPPPPPPKKVKSHRRPRLETRNSEMKQTGYWGNHTSTNNKINLVDSSCEDKSDLDRCLNRVVYNQSVEGLPYTKDQLDKMCRLVRN